MLVNIHVKNMALIKEADIALGNGLNILSGETGAGKSILLGAIAVALGLQGFKGFAREGAEYALSELVFTVEKEEQRSALEAMEIPMEEDEVIISRRLSKGRATSKINGETVPVSLVKKVGALLIDIHGQHENQALLHIRKHLELLDDFAKENLGNIREEYQKSYHEYGELKKELEQAQLDNAARAKEMDFLSFEIGEIEEASLQKGEDESLEEDYKKLANGREILEAVTEAYQLCGTDGASDSTGRALRSLASVAEYDSSLKALYGQLMDVDNLLNDFSREVSSYAQELDVDEETLRSTEERLDLINRLKTKYGNTIEAILEYKEEKKKRFQVLEHYEEYLAELESRFAACRKKLDEQAEALTRIRKEAAVRFSEQVCQALQELNFLDVRFELEFRRLEDYTASGLDEVCFMISTNPGQPLRPVQDTASGGELSRIMLAVKSIMADQEKVETLIFDEIDSGISGRTAQKVSEKLAVIAGTHQVICITHLAQIAAMADVHFMIEKNIVGKETQTSIRQLNEKESIEELARILGGAEITQTVLDGAKEMKELAKASKK
ncbi:MAG: DNA repair protein RecN [Lachnospiraceae bacterium]|nr:DNA repair protein RecN [Lachnospiraceae bacterium]